MTETQLIDAMREVTEKYRRMGVTVNRKTMAVLIVNHAVGGYENYTGDANYWSWVKKVEGWLL